MISKFFRLFFLGAVIIVFCITCTQDTGTSPYDCSKTQAFFVVKSQNSDKPGQVSIQDTIGDSIYYGFNTSLPTNVDSIEIRKTTASDTIGAFITTVKNIQSRKAIDTLWNSLQLVDTGIIYLKCKAYLVCGLKLSATVSVTVLPRPANHPPKLLVPRLINVHPGDSCTLGVLASDADNFQTLTISGVKIPAGSSFDPQSHIFFWKIPGSFTGLDSVVLKVQDNGFPPLFDQKTVYLNVQTTFVNNKPIISVRGLRNIRPADTCTLLVNASDPDSLQTLTVSMLSGPKGATLKDSVFFWIPPAPFIGTDSAMFIAKDDGLPPQSDTIKVYINVASNIPVPSRPEGFKIVSRVNGWVNLNWKSSSVADFYTIFRYSMKHGPMFVVVDSVYDTLYKDFIGPMNCQYYVKANNKSGESPSSDTVVSLNSNLPPQWQKDTVNLLGTVGQVLTLTASTICVDPNGDTISFSLLAGQPIGDTLIKGVYSFTPNASDTGIFWPRMVAKDPLGLSDTLIMHLAVSAAALSNHKPVLTVMGARNIKSGTTCTLAASATDPDSNQTLSYSVTRKPASSAFNAGTGVFAWTTPVSFKGTDTVIFIVVDNGLPPMSDTMCVPILVSDTIINHPPKWQSDTIGLSATVGSALKLTFADKCIDPDGDKLVFNLLPGKPDNDTVKTDVYSFTPAKSDTGIFFPRFVAKDSAGLADTLTLRLSVIAGDRKPPYLKLVSPASDSATVGASSVSVKLVCKDSSGIASLKCAMGTDTFAVSHVDSVYSAAVTGLKSTGMNEILFVATDASVNANKDTLKVHIKYDPNMGDNSAPTLYFIKPGKDTIIGADSFVVQAVCYDAGKIASLVGLRDSTAFTLARTGTDSIWSGTAKNIKAGQYSTIRLIATDSSAARNKDTVSVRIKYDNDATGPTIVLVTPNKDSVTTSSSSYTIILQCTDASGVLSVNGASGSTMFTGLRDTGATWKINISGLAANTYTAITLIATDSSLRANKTQDTVYVKSLLTNGYTITFDKNDAAATGTMAPQTISSGASVALTANAYTKAGYTFAGWLTNAAGTTVAYADGANYTMGTANVTLYAKWTVNNYTITFDKNDAGATGTMAAQTLASGSSAALTTNGFIKAGSAFAGWATSANGSVVYLNQASYTMGTANVTLYAKWTANSYAVTFDKNDAGASGTMAVQPILSGSSAALTANAFTKTGSSFAGWATSSAGAVVYTDGANYTMGTANITLYAKWTANTHTVTFDKNDAGASGTMAAQTIAEGATAPLTANAFTKTGSFFAGWATSSAGAVVYADGANYTMGTANVTLYAKWTVNSHTVIFDKNDAGASGTMAAQTIAEGATAPLTANAFTKTGSFFAGWATSSAGAVAYADGANYTMGTANVTLYAKWTVNSHTVTFDKNDAGASGTMAAQTIAEGATAPLTANAFTKTGSFFAGWATSSAGAVAYADGANYTMGTANVTLYAKWTANPHTVTFDKNDAGASGTMAAQTIAEGATAPLTANAFTKTGSSFAGWATSATGAVVYGNGTNYTMGTANVTLYAKWTVNTHSVTFDKNDAGASGAMAAQTIAEGATAPLTANAFTKTGSSFAGWATSAAGAVAYTDGANYTMGTANVTLYAKWTVNSHTVTFDKNDAGASGTMAAQPIAEGATVNLTANGFTKAGWSFAGWATYSSGSAVYANQDNYTMGTANVTLYAKWTANNYTITFNKNDGAASGSMPSQTIASGSSSPLNAISFTKAGWSFAGWATSASGAVVYGNQANYAMGTTNVTLYAKWSANNYTITFDRNNLSASGYMSSQTIASGSSANLTANEYADGCRTFIGWATGPSDPPTYSNQANYTMGTSSVTLYAIWAVNPLTISPAEGSTIRACIYDPVILSASCAASYTWYYSVDNMSAYAPITSDNPDFSGAGTSTLAVTSNYAPPGCYIYCMVTDLAGNQFKSGTWILWTGNCH